MNYTRQSAVKHVSLTGFKKKVASELPETERRQMIEWEDEEGSDIKKPCIKRQAELLGVKRSTLYYQPRPEKPYYTALRKKIHDIWAEHTASGSRMIRDILRLQGIAVARKTVQKLMQELGIRAICPGPNLSKRRLEHQVYPYLLRNVEATHCNHIWGIDITYIKLKSRDFIYLVAVVDWYSRSVVSWRLEQTLEIEFVLEAVKEALGKGTPEYWNSDQGSHFTSPKYIELLEESEVKISMDGKGRCIDNVFTERFWWSVKYEEVYLNEYNSPWEARRAITKYIDFYNEERPHSAHKGLPPAWVYRGQLEKPEVIELSEIV